MASEGGEGGQSRVSMGVSGGTRANGTKLVLFAGKGIARTTPRRGRSTERAMERARAVADTAACGRETHVGRSRRTCRLRACVYGTRAGCVRLARLRVRIFCEKTESASEISRGNRLSTTFIGRKAACAVAGDLRFSFSEPRFSRQVSDFSKGRVVPKIVGTSDRVLASEASRTTMVCRVRRLPPRAPRVLALALLVSAFVSGGASDVVRGPRGSIDGATMRISTTLGTSAATKRQKSPTLSDEGTAKTHTVGCRPRGSASASSPTFPVGPEDDAESVSVSRNK